MPTMTLVATPDPDPRSAQQSEALHFLDLERELDQLLQSNVDRHRHRLLRVQLSASPGEPRPASFRSV